MTLREDLDALTVQSKQFLPGQTFDVLGDAIDALKASGVLDGALSVGDPIPDFELPDAGGRLVRSVDLRARGSLVLTFYRGGWCPYCSLQLRALEQRRADIEALGATLVAISPQTPDHSLTVEQRLALTFPVLSDAGNRVARRFGLVFKLDAAVRAVYEQLGADLADFNGDDSFELPAPATFVVARDGHVVGAAVDSDYRTRVEPQTVLNWLTLAG